MADVRTNLPNLKISVDNTASSDESDNDVEIRGNDDEDSETQEIPEDEKSDSEDGEVGKDDVEFHVRLGSFAGRDKKSHCPTKSKSVNPEDSTTPKASDLTDKSPNKGTRDDKEGSQKGKSEGLLQQRLYMNKSGSFVTGIDVTSQDAMEKREKRARRFGVHQEGMEVSQMNISLLYKSLGLKEADFEKEEVGLRKEALHVWGTDDMSTNDIFAYFTEFPPSAIEWINDTSCNIVWLDKVTATRALLKLSVSCDVAMAKLQTADTKKTKEGQGMGDRAREGMGGEDNSSGENPAESSTVSEASSFSKEGCRHEASSALEEKMEVDDDDDDELDLVGDVGCSTKDRDSTKGREQADGTDKGRDSQKRREAERKEGEDSDGSSPTGSSSGSTSGSESNSRSNSTSATGSDSSSDSESETWEFRGSKKKKTSDEQSNQTHDVPSPVEEVSHKKKRQPIPWPPGKWRLGVPCKKAKYLFLRFATKADKKMPGAEKKSKYYQKFGNPNYGGLKGLISGSRKRKLRYAQLNKEEADAQDKISQAHSSGQRKERGGGGGAADNNQREEGEISADDSVVEEEEEEEEKEVVIETPKDLRQLLNREAGGIRLTLRVDHHDADPATSQKKPETGREGRTGGDDEDEMDFEAELKHLLEEPPKKRVMRMHADDEEEKIRARRAKAGMLTVTAGALQGGVRSRLGERVQQQDIRKFEDEEEGEALSDDDDEKDFNSAAYVPHSRANQSSEVADLRSKLSARKQTYNEPKRESIRIEVFD